MDNPNDLPDNASELRQRLREAGYSEHAIFNIERDAATTYDEMTETKDEAYERTVSYALEIMEGRNGYNR